VITDHGMAMGSIFGGMGSKNVNKLRSAVGGVNVEIGAGERVS